MGRVYEAKDTRLNETVAINVLAPQLRDTRGVDRFRGAFWKAFEKNRGRVHQYVEWDGIPFAVLAYSTTGHASSTLRTSNRPHNKRMQQTASRVGRAGNGVVDAAAACSLTLAPAPLLIRVLSGPNGRAE
jgi:hypothetical protein